MVLTEVKILASAVRLMQMETKRKYAAGQLDQDATVL